MVSGPSSTVELVKRRLGLSGQRDDARQRNELHGHQHRDVSGGWLRPAVFGAMDGLVTNVSLIAGVGGGGGLATRSS